MNIGVKSSENRSEIWSVSSHEPSPSDILFLSSSSGGEIENTASTSPIIFLDATPPSPIHCQKDASPIACSTPKMCCPKRCLQQHLEQAADINASFQRRNQCDQTQFLLDMFHVTKGGSTHLVNGVKVCRNAFLAVYGISRRRYQQVLKEYLRGSIKALRKPTSRTITTKTADAEAWMAKYFESISDCRMPHNGQLHLPHFLSKRDVYNIMMRQMENQKMPTISLQQFYATWTMKFKNVVIPKVSISGPAYMTIFILSIDQFVFKV